MRFRWILGFWCLFGHSLGQSDREISTTESATTTRETTTTSTPKPFITHTDETPPKHFRDQNWHRANTPSPTVGMVVVILIIVSLLIVVGLAILILIVSNKSRERRRAEARERALANQRVPTPEPSYFSDRTSDYDSRRRLASVLEADEDSILLEAV